MDKYNMDNFNPNFNDTKELVNLFGDEAEKIAKLLNDGKTFCPDITTTQFRLFYDKVLELNDKAKGLSVDEFDIKILPFLKLLNSKVQYSKSRGHCGENFVKMMEKSIKKVGNETQLQNFKYFIEAIIGYMPKR